MKIHKFFLANLGELIGNWPKNTLKSYKFYGRIFGPYSIYFCTKFLTTLHGTSYTTPCSTDDKFPPSKVCLFFLPKNGRWTLYAKVYTHESCTYMVLQILEKDMAMQNWWQGVTQTYRPKGCISTVTFWLSWPEVFEWRMLSLRRVQQILNRYQFPIIKYMATLFDNHKRFVMLPLSHTLFVCG